MALLPDRHQFAKCKEASGYAIPHEFAQSSLKRKSLSALEDT